MKTIKLIPKNRGGGCKNGCNWAGATIMIALNPIKKAA
jgi:hypothetical protein